LLAARLESLIAQLTKIVFLEVSPGLFDRHRQILALMLWFAQLKAKVLGNVLQNYEFYEVYLHLGPTGRDGVDGISIRTEPRDCEWVELLAFYYNNV